MRKLIPKLIPQSRDTRPPAASPPAASLSATDAHRHGNRRVVEQRGGFPAVLVLELLTIDYRVSQKRMESDTQVSLKSPTKRICSL